MRLSDSETAQRNARIDRNLRKFYFSNQAVEQLLSSATPKMLSFMDTFLCDELQRREVRRKEALLRHAGFPVVKDIKDFDFSQCTFPEEMPKEAVLNLNFIKMRHSLVFYGVCGSGKTMLSICLGIAACRAGYSVRFFTLAQLANRLAKAAENNSLESFLESLRKLDLLIIDEWGYTSLSGTDAGYVFRVISDSYECKSLIITTNLPFGQWGRLVSDDQLATAIIDRIVHYGHLIDTGTKDWRLTLSPMNGQVVSSEEVVDRKN